jgi:UDP-N-acetylglucosamine 2-epimerase (non-hydrolysing)
MKRILFILGTRPEAIKLCPVILHLRSRADEFDVKTCITAQHRALLDQVLSVFNVRPDYDLDLMLPGQTLFQSTSRILGALEPVLNDAAPDMVLVQGDTTTTLCGALAGFYKAVPVGHVEAGLRTGDMRQPFPEEMNRVLATRVSALHFAATDWASENLLHEGVPPDSVYVTGNSGIDAVLYVKNALESGALIGWNGGFQPDPRKKLIVVTAHRRESFGVGFERICSALGRLAARGDVEIVFPVHPNPNVREPVNRHLQGRPGVHLIEPLEYVPFVDLMRQAYILITDSGGVQEEGPSLGKPILVMREKTERPEAVHAGTVKLVGTNEEKIVTEANRLLDDAGEYARMSLVHNPYGDGRASERIADIILQYFARSACASGTNA